MSVSFAGEPRSLSAAAVAAPVVVKPLPASPAAVKPVPAGPAAVASSTVAAAPPVLAPPVVSPIVQAVERRLRESSYYYLRSIRCAFESGVITVRGRVPTFYLKQTVQAIVEKIDGVEQVINLVEVFDSRRPHFPASDSVLDLSGGLIFRATCVRQFAHPRLAAAPASLRRSIAEGFRGHPKTDGDCERFCAVRGAKWDCPPL